MMKLFLILLMSSMVVSINPGLKKRFATISPEERVLFIQNTMALITKADDSNDPAIIKKALKILYFLSNYKIQTVDHVLTLEIHKLNVKLSKISNTTTD